MHAGKIIDSIEFFDVIECESCNFRHLDPIPTEKELNRFYTENYFQTHKSDFIKQDNIDIDYWKIIYKERLINFHKYSPGRKILDVGCGAGMFLEYAQKNYWDCYGIEPSDLAYNFAAKNNLSIQNVSFNDFIKGNDETYDIIVLKNVLEHLPDPQEVLTNCHDILNEDGIIYVEVPNDYNFFQTLGVQMLKEKKSWLSIPDHVNYFNFKSLKILLNRNNFKIAKRDTSFPIYGLLLFGLNFIKYKHHGKKAHQLRVKFEINMDRWHINLIKRIFYRLISKLRLGRTVIYYGQKITNS